MYVKRTELAYPSKIHSLHNYAAAMHMSCNLKCGCLFLTLAETKPAQNRLNFLRRRIGVRPLYLFTSAIVSSREPEQHLLNLIAPAGRPHLVKFYFSTGRPERRAYILVPDLHGVHSSNNSVHSSNNSTKLLLPGARKPICGTIGNQTRPPCSRCCWPSWPA